MIKFISIWHSPYSDCSYFGLYLVISFFFLSIFAWVRRVVNTNCATQPFVMYMYAFVENYEKYGYLNIDIYRSITFREFMYSDNSQLYEFTYLVKINYITGFQLFLWSELMIFFSLLWAYCHNAFSPSIWHGALWPPVYLTYFNWEGAPQYMTALLFASSAFTNWTDFSIRTKCNTAETTCALGHVLLIGLFFLVLQVWEYSISILSWKDSIYSCTFYSVTAMHGLHVIVGMVFILIALCRIMYDPYIRIDGLYYKKLKKKNLEKIYDFKILIIKTYQIIAGRHVANHFLIKKEYSHKLGILIGFFPYLLKPYYMIIYKVLNIGVRYTSRAHSIKTSINTGPIVIDIVLWAMKHILNWYKHFKVGTHWEQKFRTWLTAASFAVHKSLFNKSLHFIKFFCKYSIKNMHKLKYKYLIKAGYSIIKYILIGSFNFYFVYRPFSFNWIYKSAYSLEYRSLLILFDINVIQKHFAYLPFCETLANWVNFQQKREQKSKVSNFIFKLKLLHTPLIYTNIFFKYEKFLHTSFWLFCIFFTCYVPLSYLSFVSIYNFYLFTFIILLFFLTYIIKIDLKFTGTFDIWYVYWRYSYIIKWTLINEIREFIWKPYNISWNLAILKRWYYWVNSRDLRYTLFYNLKNIISYPTIYNSKYFEMYINQSSWTIKTLILLSKYSYNGLYLIILFNKWFISYPLIINSLYSIIDEIYWSLFRKKIDINNSSFTFYNAYDRKITRNIHKKYEFNNKLINKDLFYNIKNINEKNSYKISMVSYIYWLYFYFFLNFKVTRTFYIFSIYLKCANYIKNLIRLYIKIYCIKKYILVKHLVIFFNCLKNMLSNKKLNITVKHSLFFNYLLFKKSYKLKGRYYYMNWYDTIGYMSYTNKQFLYYLNFFFSNRTILNLRKNLLIILYKNIRVKLFRKPRSEPKISFKYDYIYYFNNYLYVKVWKYRYFKKLNVDNLYIHLILKYWQFLRFHTRYRPRAWIWSLYFPKYYIYNLFTSKYLFFFIYGCSLEIYYQNYLIKLLYQLPDLNKILSIYWLYGGIFIKSFISNVPEIIFFILIIVNFVFVILILEQIFMIYGFFFLIIYEIIGYAYYRLYYYFFLIRKYIKKYIKVCIFVCYIYSILVISIVKEILSLVKDYIKKPTININYYKFLNKYFESFWNGTSNFISNLENPSIIVICLFFYLNTYPFWVNLVYNFFIHLENLPMGFSNFLLDSIIYFYHISLDLEGEFYNSYIRHFPPISLNSEEELYIIVQQKLWYTFYWNLFIAPVYLLYWKFKKLFFLLIIFKWVQKYSNYRFYFYYNKIIKYFILFFLTKILFFNKNIIFLIKMYPSLLYLYFKGTLNNNINNLCLKLCIDLDQYSYFHFKYLKYLKHNNFIDEMDYIYNFLYFFSISNISNIIGIICFWYIIYTFFRYLKSFIWVIIIFFFECNLFFNIVSYKWLLSALGLILFIFLKKLYQIDKYSNYLYFKEKLFEKIGVDIKMFIGLSCYCSHLNTFLFFGNYIIYLSINLVSSLYYLISEIIFSLIFIDILNYYKGQNRIIYKIFSLVCRTLIKRKFYFNKFKWYYLNFSTTEWFIFFRLSAWYWHFVDIIWFIVYAVCYVM